MKIPSTLRLPFAAASRFRLEQILVAQLGCPWSHGWKLREMFALSGPEEDFARRMLDRRRNLWLYRTNQRHSCGDFIAIDMSSTSARRTVAIELKANEALRLGAGGVQLANLDAALDELAGVILGGQVITVQGDAEAVFLWLGR